MAAGFPARVAACPQRTKAILTKYDTDRGFLAWAAPLSIRVPHFAHAQEYVADLLDGYMQFKRHLARLRRALDAPSAYVPSAAADAAKIGLVDFVAERKRIRAEMCKIVAEIEAL